MSKRKYSPEPADNVFAHNVSRYLIGVDSFWPFFTLAAEYFRQSVDDPHNLSHKRAVDQMIANIALYTHTTPHEVRQQLVRAANVTTNPTTTTTTNNPEDF